MKHGRSALPVSARWRNIGTKEKDRQARLGGGCSVPRYWQSIDTAIPTGAVRLCARLPGRNQEDR